MQKNSIINLIRKYYNDSLYKNSIYLILSTGIMSFFGFFFWIINARLYTPQEVGLATTLISIMTLISGFSILGLDMGLVRFLGKSEKKNKIVNSVFILTSLTSLLTIFVFINGILFFSPKLAFLKENLLFGFLFGFFTVLVTINNVIDGIFLAYRSAKFTLFKNTFLSIIKVILPIFFIAFGAYGIYMSVGIANLIAVIVAFGFLIYVFNYRCNLSLKMTGMKKIISYSFGNYISGFIGGLPAMILPILIFNKMGPQSVAYFYMAMMIANFIFIIPFSVTQSLFAEGTHSENDLKKHILKAGKIISLILIPVIFITVLFGNYILLAFGKQYSLEAFSLLQIMAFSSIFIAINGIFGTVLRIRQKIKELIFISIFSTTVILSGCYYFSSIKLIGIGIAWILGQMSVTILYLIIRKRVLVYENSLFNNNI